MKTDIHVGDTGLEIQADCSRISPPQPIHLFSKENFRRDNNLGRSKDNPRRETRQVRYLTVAGDLNEPE